MIKLFYKPRNIVCFIIIVIILSISLFLLFRSISNEKLAKEIRMEYQKWQKTLPKLTKPEDGMPIILKGVEKFRIIKHEPIPELYFFGFDDLADKSNKAYVLREIENKNEALKAIYKGLTYSKFQAPIDNRYLLEFRYAAKLITLKGDSARIDGNIPEAIREYMSALRLGATLCTSDDLASRTAELDILYRVSASLIPMLSEERIDETVLSNVLEDLMELQSKRGSFYPVVKAEFYSYLNLVGDLIEGKSKAEDVFYPDYKRNLYWLIRTSKYIHNYRDDVKNYREDVETYNAIDPTQYYKLPRKFLEQLSLKREGRLIPNWSAIIVNHAKAESILRGTIVLAALQLCKSRNGKLPRSLMELAGIIPKHLLIDPLSGSSFIYRIQGDDFFLYSVGYDRIDRKCSANTSMRFELDQVISEDSDIVFHSPNKVERDVKKEK